MKKSILKLILPFCIFTYSCNSDYTRPLGSGYIYKHEGTGANFIYNTYGHEGIPNDIIQYNNDKKYIIAQQKPSMFINSIYEKSYDYKYGLNYIYFWIIDKKDNSVIGPLDSCL